MEGQHTHHPREPPGAHGDPAEPQASPHLAADTPRLLLSPEDSSRGSVTSSPGCGPRPSITVAHTAVERRPPGPSHPSLARILRRPQQGPSLPTIHPTPVNKPPNPDPPREAAPAPRTPAPVLGVPPSSCSFIHNTPGQAVKFFLDIIRLDFIEES